MKRSILIVAFLLGGTNLFGQSIPTTVHLENCERLQVFYLNHSEGNGSILDTLHDCILQASIDPSNTYVLFVSDAFRPSIYWSGMDVKSVFRSLRLTLKDPPQGDRDKSELRTLLHKAMLQGHFQIQFHFFLTTQDLMNIPNERASMIGELPRELSDFMVDTKARVSPDIHLYFPTGVLCDVGLDRLRLSYYMMNYFLHCLS